MRLPSNRFVKAGDKVHVCRSSFVRPGLSTLTQTASPLPSLVAQRVALTLETIISDFF